VANMRKPEKEIWESGRGEGLAIDDFCSPWIVAQNAEWRQLLHLGTKRSFNKGTVIIGNDQVIDDLYYLHSGRVKLAHIAKNGREKILFYVERGNVFGEVPFFARKPIHRQFSALSACQVYTFSRECFYEKIAPFYPELLITLLEVMGNKTRILASQACALDSIISRLCKVLIYVVERGKGEERAGKIHCDQGIAKEELASILGVHRATLFSAIAQLKQAGILEDVSRKHLIIMDYAQLVSLAQGE